MSLRLRLIAAATPPASGDTFVSDGELDTRTRDMLAAIRAKRELVTGFAARTSPARAARETASLLGYDAIDDTNLRDIDIGSWIGRPLAEIARGEDVAGWSSDPAFAGHGGESIATLCMRAGDWLEARTETGKLVCVTHPSVIRACVVRTLGAPFEAFMRIEARALHATDLTHDGRRWALRAANIAL